MSQENPNKQNKNLEGVPTREDFIKSHLDGLERVEKEGDIEVAILVAKEVDSEFKGTVLQSLPDIKSELKSQYILKSEVLLGEFYEQIIQVLEESKKLFDVESENIRAKYFEKFDALQREFESGVDVIQKAHATSEVEKAMSQIRPLSESIRERRQATITECEKEVSRLSDDIREQRTLKIEELSREAHADIKALGEEFWSAYLDKVNLLIEEFKS